MIKKNIHLGIIDEKSDTSFLNESNQTNDMLMPPKDASIVEEK